LKDRNLKILEVETVEDGADLKLFLFSNFAKVNRSKAEG
jgi:hypothetical protein